MTMYHYSQKGGCMNKILEVLGTLAVILTVALATGVTAPGLSVLGSVLVGGVSIIVLAVGFLVALCLVGHDGVIIRIRSARPG
jgi:hypothetical protein